MIPIRSFRNLIPGDIIYTKEPVSRQVGSLTWYGGKLCDAGERLVVTDVYPTAIRVIHSEGGIHFFSNYFILRSLKLIEHGEVPNKDVARHSNGDEGYGSWPHYKGQYRFTKTFAFNAKQAPQPVKRQQPKRRKRIK